MTPAEKAFTSILSAHAVDSFGWKEEIALIESTLQRAAECERTWLDKKAAMADAAAVCKLTDENKALKDKSQILLKALKLARIDVKVGRGADWIIKDMDNPITDCNSDETGIGL